VKREDFIIEGIPEGYRVYDVDLSASGRPLAVIGHASDGGGPAYVRLPGAQVPLRPSALWRHPAIDQMFCSWIARWVGEARIVTALPRCGSNEEINAFTWGEAGNPLSEFHAGDGIQDILADDHLIVITYFDEGVFSRIAPGQEGVAFFSPSGDFKGGYMSALGDAAVHIYDCYCACWTDQGWLSFFPYGQPSFPLIILQIDGMSQEVWTTPHDLHGAQALTFHREDTYLHSPYEPTGLAGKLVRWRRAGGGIDVVGEFPVSSSRLRGLPGGRFIAPKPDGYTILSFE